jgi:NADH-quinone oxidoreductase subunit G
MSDFVTVDGMQVPLNGERNLLEVIRKAGVSLPTFCYHSELSVYGACRMCVCEIEGKGLLATCSTPPEPGLVIHTSTKKTTRIRKMALELLLANHHGHCPTCHKNKDCRLQDIAEMLDVQTVRFEKYSEPAPIDTSSPSIIRDPGKCILCGDCVRMCREVQGVGVLDFAGRGSNVRVSPAFNKNMADVECINCGQCITCCPTGALTVKSDVKQAWDAIYDAGKTVVVQVAPAVRTAVCEEFGCDGELAMGKLATALRRLGFDRIYDTSFAADLTTVEEGTEFLKRLQTGERLPQFTSCCPGWVKYAEQFYPQYLDNLSTCKSPQQMFGALAKQYLPQELGVKREDLVVVSIMPCTAKKFEASRPEFADEAGVADVDIVLTTQEVIRMIRQSGIIMADIEPEALDMPFGFKTGAGLIFGASGGVAEAVLRLATAGTLPAGGQAKFTAVRGLKGLKEVTVPIGGRDVRLAVVNGLANAKHLVERMSKGEVEYDIIEVMACRGGCIGGAGQPLPNDIVARERRRGIMYDCDSMQPLRNAGDNPYVQEAYTKWLGEPNSHTAHELLHTVYQNRRRIVGDPMEVRKSKAEHKATVRVCLGTCCYLNGAYDTMHNLLTIADERGFGDRVEVKASFCFENCAGGPSVEVDGVVHSQVTPDTVRSFVDKVIEPALAETVETP